MPRDIPVGGAFVSFRARNEQFIRAGKQNVQAIRQQRAAMRQLRRTARNVRQAFTGVTAQLTGFVAATAGIGSSISSFNRFDVAMTRLNSLIGISNEEIDGLRTNILELGKSGVGRVTDLAEGYFFLASAGLEGQQAMDALVASAKASQIGLGTVEEVATGVTSALGAWRNSADSVEKITATLIATVREGRFAPEQLAREIGRAGAIAQAAGANFQELGAGLAFLSRSRDLNLASTQLIAVLRAFIKPSVQAEEALASIGLTVADLRDQISRGGLLATLNDLKTSLESNDIELRKVFKSTEALSGVLSLTGENAAAAKDVFDSLAATTENDLVKSFQAFAESDTGKLQIALSQLQVLGVQLAQQTIPAMVSGFESLRENSDLVRLAVIGMVGSFAAAKIAPIIASLYTVIRTTFILRGALGVTTLAAVALRTALLRTGVGILIVGIGELIYQFFRFRGEAESTAEAFSLAWDNVYTRFRSVTTRLGAILLDFQASIVGLVANMIIGFNKFFRTVVSGFSSFFRTVGSGIANFATGVYDLFAVLGSRIKIIFINIANSIIERINGLLTGISDALNSIGIDNSISLANLINVPEQRKFLEKTAFDFGQTFADNFERSIAGYSSDADNEAIQNLVDQVADLRERADAYRLLSTQLRELANGASESTAGVDALANSFENYENQVNEALQLQEDLLNQLGEGIDNTTQKTLTAGEMMIQQMQRSFSRVTQIQRQLDETLRESYSRIGDGISQFFTNTITGFRNAGDEAKAFARTLINDVLNAFIRSGLQRLFGGAIFGIPGFQRGGLADRGLALVGEAGPEIVDFRSPGRVYTNEQLQSAISGGGNVFNFSPVIQTSDGEAVRRELFRAFPTFQQGVLNTIQQDSRRNSGLRESLRA